MSEFIMHTQSTAPQASKSLLLAAEKQLGFIPNLMAAMAESPATLEAYQALSTLFDQTAFTVTERQLVLLSISRYRNCTYCLAAHGTVSKLQRISTEIIDAVYYNQPLADSKLESLRCFTRKVLEVDGWADQSILQTFYQAGFQKQHVLEIVLAISFKTLSNYINHINDTPIDTVFLEGIPDNRKTTVTSQ